ncbi:MAG: insulinase family protein, partial [candidate division Zixibacteria bacterium]|nr:insulinase family protein [candidate division Zixibacteria bacterium]
MIRPATAGHRPCFIALLVSAILTLAGCGCRTARGAHAVVVPDEHADGIWVRLLFPSGSAYDPPGKEGLARLTAHALQQGSEQMRARREAALSSLGARLDLSVDRDVAVFDGYCPTSAWPELSSVLVSIFREPSPESLDVPRLIADQLAALERIRSDDVALAQAALQHYLYRNHPYGHPPEGRDSALGALTGLDVHDFWRRHYTSGSYALGLAGAVPQAADRTLQAALRAVLSTAQPDTLSIPDPVVTTPNAFIIERS